MTKIYAKNKNFNGVSASIHFTNGVGETDDKYLIEWFKKHGYEVGEKSTLDDEQQEPTLDDLKKIADELGIDYGTNIGYQTLLQRINAKKEA